MTTTSSSSASDSGWRFISSVDAFAGKPYRISHDEYLHLAKQGQASELLVEFISLQDLKGSIVAPAAITTS